MKLSTILEGELWRRMYDGAILPTATLSEADGVSFLCPKCFTENGGNVGTHRVLCWFAGRVPDDLDPKPGRWHPAGASLEDLTFIGPGSVSVELVGGCQWHGFVRNGEATLQ